MRRGKLLVGVQQLMMFPGQAAPVDQIPELFHILLKLAATHPCKSGMAVVRAGAERAEPANRRKKSVGRFPVAALVKKRIAKPQGCAVVLRCDNAGRARGSLSLIETTLLEKRASQTHMGIRVAGLQG
jgi:hypothetical protein